MSRERRLVIWGASGHAAVVADAARSEGRYEVSGFLDDASPERKGSVFCGAPVLGTREELEGLARAGVGHVIPGFGDCEARMRVSAVARDRGFGIATVVHPGATVASDVEVGEGSVVVAGAVINTGARVGRDVIVNTSASVDHHCVLEDGVHISPGAHLAGGVHVGRAAWVGIGAVVADGVRVGPGSVVGAGAVVVRDVPGGMVAYGVPAKAIREANI